MRRFAHPFAVAAFVTVSAYLLGGVGYLGLIEEHIEYIWYRISPDVAGDDRIVVVEIDDATLESYTPEIPFARDQIALLLNDLAEPPWDATAIVLDLYFEGSDQYSASNDSLLGMMIENYRDKVITSVFLPTTGGALGRPDSSVLTCLGRFGYDPKGIEEHTAPDPVLPPANILCASSYCGHIDIFPGLSGVCRGLPLFVTTHGITIGALALEGLRNYLGLSSSDIKIENDKVSIGPFRVPVNRRGDMNLKYSGRRNGYRKYSMLEIFDDTISSPTERRLTNKIVLVGVNSSTHFPKEVSYTPYGDIRPNVYLHADVISNILNGRHLILAPGWASVMLMLLTLGWFAAIHIIERKMYRILLGVCAIAILLLVDYLSFQLGYIVSIVPPLAAGVLLSVYTGFYTVGEQAGIITEQAKEVGELRVKEQSLLAIEQELRVARTIQENLMPHTVPSLAGFELFSINIPAKEVSGDFYDFVELPDGGLAISIGDVSGKGISAALLMATSQAVIRSETLKHQSSHFSCADLVTDVNRLIHANTEPGRFVTMFYSLLDVASGSLRFVNAGHNYPLLVNPGGQILSLDTGGLILGVLSDSTYISQRVDFKPGQNLVYYTDGLTEAVDGTGEMFGDDRFKQLLIENSHLSAPELGRVIVEEMRGFSEGAEQADDITLVLLGAKPS